ncbi:MAG: tRNA(Ile)-lysidine synthetase [Eubacterium sp.]|jgi:tRNA(Ile)-lysidine synthase|nr:tRNA(Ile)-lysidine synthetase [Eubacterium sp.]
MLKQQVLDTIKKYELINYGDGIVVGISGGYDSVCLLHILYSISEVFCLKLYPVHINHMLRGEEALRDENFVKALCASLGLEAVVKRIDIAERARTEKISLEEAGRDARYEEFERVIKETGADKIAVAHSKNDQVETLLMRIFRGTGPEGLKGIEYRRGNIIRPLLEADRVQIEHYVTENGLEAITDSSNLHTDYFRNRIRLQVIPQINSAVGSDITENLLRLSKIVVADEDYLRYNSELYYQNALLKKGKAYAELDLKQLCKMHQAICSRVLRMAFTDACKSVTGLEFVHIEKLLQLIANGRTGARLDLPLELMAQRSYNSLIIKKQGEETAEKFEYRLKVTGDTDIEIKNGIIKTNVLNFGTIEECKEFIKDRKSSDTAFFDFEKLQEKYKLKNDLQLVVRNRLDGDIFKPLKSNGTKKLKEYFIDNKIPKNDRNKLPLIAINKEIIWIIGNKTSDNYKVTDNTKSVLMITFIQLN